MKTTDKKTSDLVPYARNAKLHDETHVARIAGSIKEFGFNNPVLIDTDNSIIAGHGRVLAAQKLKLKTVPCVVLDHLSEAQKKAYRLVDNRMQEIGGGYDMELLHTEVGELIDEGFNSVDLGFDDGFFDDWNIEETEPPELSDGDRQPFQQMTFTVHDEQHEEIEAAIAKAKKDGGGESAVNENSNGNALTWICGRFNRG